MLSFDKASDGKEKIKKSKYQILLDRAKEEIEASRMIRVPIRFGMSKAEIKQIKAAVKGG